MFKFSALFSAAVPKWRGPEFVSSRQFLRAYAEHEASGKGYVKSEQLKGFLNVLFSEAKCKKVDRKLLKEFRKSYVSYIMKVKKGQWVSFYDLYTTLVQLMQCNFLLKYRGRQKLRIVDVMKIWKHYDPAGLGCIQKSNAEVFAFDLLTDVKQKTDVRVIRALAHKLSVLTGGVNGEIEFTGMEAILPCEKNICTLFPLRDKVDWDEFGFTFDIQDKFGCGTLTVDEVKILLTKIAHKFGNESDSQQVQEQMIELTKLANKSNGGVLQKEDLRILLCSRNRKQRPPLQLLRVDFP